MASADSRDASMMKSLYRDSRSRNFHSTFARADCARWLIQVVTMEAEAPTNEPSAAAIAVTTELSTGYFRPTPDDAVIGRPAGGPRRTTATCRCCTRFR